MCETETCGITLLDISIDKFGKTMFEAPPGRRVWFPDILSQLIDILSRPNMRTDFWAHLDREVPDGVLADIYDGHIWKSWIKNNWFKTRGKWEVFLQFNADGFQPFANTVYSCFAMYMVIVNLPRAIRFLRENMILVAVFEGMPSVFITKVSVHVRNCEYVYMCVYMCVRVFAY
jgi:hypothetical protein